MKKNITAINEAATDGRGPGPEFLIFSILHCRRKCPRKKRSADAKELYTNL